MRRKSRFAYKLLFYLVFFVSFHFAAAQSKKTKVRVFKYLYIEKNDNNAQHIALKNQTRIKKDNMFQVFDDRDIIVELSYNKSQKKEILEEYLKFKGDTALSDKSYFILSDSYNGKSIKYQSLAQWDFTIQIEALFSFTRMLTVDIPNIKPKLIVRKTGAIINNDQQLVKEIFNLYRAWLVKSKSENFKHISSPLAGTPYNWLGDDNDLKDLLLKEL